MARVKQGSGSGEGAAATPAPGTRASRARQSGATAGATPSASSSEPTGAPEVLGTVPTPLEDDEDDNSDLDESELSPESYVEDAAQLDGDPNQRMPDYARPGNKAVDASPPARAALPARQQAKQQSFAGKYIALARLNREDGSVVAPNDEVHLDDAEARHFFGHKVVQAVGRRAANQGVKDLPSGQDFGGSYKALARLKHDDETRSTLPGETVVLTDAEARHYLASGVVESASGFEL